MSVVSCDELWEDRSGDDSSDNSASVTRSFRVITDDASDNQHTIGLYTSGLYPKGQFHPNDVTLRIARVGFKNLSDPKMWVVTLFYERRLNIPGDLGGITGSGGGGGGSQPEGQPNPILRKARYKFRSETYQQPREYDYSVPALVLENSAGEPLEGVSAERGRMIFTAEYNSLVNPWRLYEELLYTCNAAGFIPLTGGGTAFLPGECLFVEYSAEEVTEQFTYWQIMTTFRIQNFGRGPWYQTLIVDRGFRQVVGTKSDGTPDTELITDRYGTPVTRPMKLDGSGFVLDQSADPVDLVFTLYPAKDWSILEPPIP